MNFVRLTALICATAWLLLATGCKPSASERKYRTVTGTASAIDVNTGRVSMEWKNQKTGRVRTLSGRVTRNTEIFINGISASLESVRIGDRATVVVYPDPNRREQWIVTSVSIDREQDFVPEMPLPGKADAEDSP